jgi:rRNA-processing protein FCF1
MKYFILDTNILIKDPATLTRWSPNYKIIIPKFLYGELDKVTSRLGPVGQFWKVLDQSTKTGFITVYDKEVEIPEEVHSRNYNQKLSYVDLQLFELTRQFSKENKDVVLVTNDRALRVFTEEYKIKTFDLFQFQTFTASSKTTDLEQLQENETINQYQNRRFIYGLVFGILLTVSAFLIKSNFDLIFEKINVWGTVILLLLTGIIFFLFRTNYRLFYGVLEFAFGFYVSIRIFTEKSFDYNSIGTIEIAQIITGIYVMVRGLSNIDDGTAGTKLEPVWKKITRLRKNVIS